MARITMSTTMSSIQGATERCQEAENHTGILTEKTSWLNHKPRVLHPSNLQTCRVSCNFSWLHSQLTLHLRIGNGV